jgi:DNA-binding transcriptional MerR regulator
MRVGQLTREAGITSKAVRYYEARGFLTSRRSPAGYREFGAEAVAVVRAIQAGRRLGFKLEDLRDVLVAVARGTKPCADLQRLIDEKRKVVRRRVRELLAFDRYLESLAIPTEGPIDDSPCPILSRVMHDAEQRFTRG